MLQEGNQGSGDRNHLNRRQGDVIHLLGRHLLKVLAVANRNQIGLDASIGFGGDVTRGHPHFVLSVSRQVDGITVFDDHSVLHLPERGLDEAVLIHPGVGGQGVDQTGVRAFRRLDRAETAVMGGMDITDSKAGALPGETTRSKGRNAALVGQLSQRVRLIHELAQLAGAEELLDRRHQWLGVHQLGRGERIGLADRHPLLDDSLEAVEAHPHLVLQQLAHGTNAAVAQVIDVVEAGATDIQLEVDQVVEGGEHVLMGEGAHRVGDGEAELFVDLVATNPAEVVALGVEEAGLQELLTTTHRGWFTWTQFLVKLQQGLVFRADALIIRGINRLFVELRVTQLIEHVVV